MTKFWAVRIGDAMHADGPESQAQIAKVPLGKPLQIEVKQPRNPRHHRLFFKLCQRIAEGVGSDTLSIERAFKIETGHYDSYVDSRGRRFLELRSIAFHNMDQIAFNEFWERCVQAAYDKWGIDPKDVADLLTPEEVQKTK